MFVVSLNCKPLLIDRFLSRTRWIVTPERRLEPLIPTGVNDGGVPRGLDRILQDSFGSTSHFLHFNLGPLLSSRPELQGSCSKSTPKTIPGHLSCFLPPKINAYAVALFVYSFLLLL